MLALTAYPPSAASTRIRVSQFIPRLAESGIEVTLHPFLNEVRYGSFRGEGRWAVARLAGAVADLTGTLRTLADFDVVWVQRGVAPGMDGAVLRAIEGARVPAVFDFDDAIFLPQEGGRRWVEALRRPGPTTRAWCRAARRVLAGNRHLASFARNALGLHQEDKVHILPSVADTAVLRPAAAHSASATVASEASVPTLGWVGTDTTVPYLEALAPALAALARRIRYRLLVVAGERIPRIPGVEMETLRWTESGEASALQRMEAGLYPLDDTPWSRGKCGFKAIQYLACGVPCVASPVGVLPQVVVHGVTGLLASTDAAWVEACLTVLGDAATRARMGAEGRARVQALYSVDAALPRLIETLEGAARTNDA